MHNNLVTAKLTWLIFIYLPDKQLNIISAAKPALNSSAKIRFLHYIFISPYYPCNVILGIIFAYVIVVARL